jgi:hypothetical protein
MSQRRPLRLTAERTPGWTKCTAVGPERRCAPVSGLRCRRGLKPVRCGAKLPVVDDG